MKIAGGNLVCVFRPPNPEACRSPVPAQAGRGRSKATLGIRLSLTRRGCCQARPRFPEGPALQGELMGVMHQPITDGVGEGRIADALVPVADGELPGQERGPGPMAIVHDLEEVSSFPVRQGRESPII